MELGRKLQVLSSVSFLLIIIACYFLRGGKKVIICKQTIMYKQGHEGISVYAGIHQISTSRHFVMWQNQSCGIKNILYSSVKPWSEKLLETFNHPSHAFSNVQKI